MALNVRFLERSGLPRVEALTAVGLSRVAAAVVHSVTLAVLIPLVIMRLTADRLPGWALLGGAAALLAVAAVAVAVPRARRRAAAALAPSLATVRSVLTSPRRLGGLLGGSWLVSGGRALAFAACLRALGVPAPLLPVVALYLASEAAGALGQTPGGLGVLDGTLLAGLSSLGVLAASALAAVLVFRLLTFWLPAAPGALALRQLRRAGLL